MEGNFVTGPTRTEGGITPEFMHGLFVDGVVGTKEFRNWLAKVDPNFGDIRDADVDNEIDRLARERAEELRNLRAKEREEPSNKPE